MEPVPITLITGFLGSGKTTLLNHILQGSHGIRIAVLLNEFGEISIDRHLISRRDEDLLELTNGCICCTVRDDLLRSIAILLDRPRAPEHIVIETTGLADPIPIAQQLLDPRVQGDIRLDAIVTLVDAANFDRNLDYAEQAYAQILSGDILLVNKTDLVPSEVLDQIDAGLRRLNAAARVVRCVQARVNLDVILGLGLDRPTPAFDQAAHRHAHVDDFSAVSFRTRAALDLDTFCRLLEDLPGKIFRAKGVLRAVGVPTRLVFHLVGGRWTVSAGDAWPPGEDRLTEMMFIGKHLTAEDRATLERRLAACTEEPGARKETP